MHFRDELGSQQALRGNDKVSLVIAFVGTEQVDFSSLLGEDSDQGQTPQV